MTCNKAVFIDRDGTINEERGYLASKDELVLIPGSVEAMKMLQGAGYLLFVITNQAGIGLGFITEEDVESLNDYFLGKLKQEGIEIQKLYCCIHAADDGCDCRKPSPLFLNQAQKEFDIDMEQSFSVGDHLSDVLVGQNAGATGLYVLTGHGSHHTDDPRLEGISIFADLLEAAEWIAIR